MILIVCVCDGYVLYSAFVLIYTFLLISFFFVVALFACDKMWVNVFFCFIYVKIKFTFSYSYHSSNLGHVRKYTHKRSSFCYFYFTILHQVATIFVVSSVFFCFLQFGRNFPHFPCVIFLFYIWGGRILFFVKIVLKSLFSVSFMCFFHSGRKEIHLFA